MKITLISSSIIFLICSFERAEEVLQRCSIEKGVLRNFAKFTGKHRCSILFFNRPATLLKRLWHRCFSCEFCENSKNTFLTEHLWSTAFERDIRTLWKLDRQTDRHYEKGSFLYSTYAKCSEKLTFFIFLFIYLFNTLFTVQ